MSKGGLLSRSIACAKYLAWCGIWGIPVSIAQAQTTPADSAAQELLRQQERQRVLRQQQEARPDVRLERPVAADETRLPEGESPCFRIDRIALVGEAAERFQWALTAANPSEDPAIGRCLGVAGISLTLKRVQNAIIERGYVTTRVLAAPQDIKEGELTLTLIPGRIHAIRFTDDSGARATLWNALPAAPGDLLNLRDIEQGLENFKRVPTAEADIQIAPAEGPDVKPGESDLVIAWKQREMPLRLSLAADDSGSKYTGKYQGSVTVSYDHALALNDLFYLSFSHDLGGGEAGSRGTRGYTAHYDIPWGYWQLGLTGGQNRYYQSVAGANSSIIYSGTSSNLEVALSRVLQRDARGKTTLNVKAWRKSSNNFIDDTEVLVQRRVEGGWELGIGRSQSIGSTTLAGKAAYKRGTGAFGSLTAPEDAFGEGTSHFELINAEINLNMPLQWGSSGNLQYISGLRGQWNRTPLVPLDRFAIGGRYTVRGFDGEQQLSADRGWLWRNELAWVDGFYAALDYGSVSGPSARNLVGTRLSGMALGWRGSLSTAQYDLFIGAPVSKPQYFRASRWVVGINLNWSI
jgi:hemolysin activation/secretion protein